MKCPQCGQICRTKREFCALCGAPLKRNPWRVILAVLIVILVLGILGLVAYQQFMAAPQEPEAAESRPAAPVQTPEAAAAPEPAGETGQTEAGETAAEPETREQAFPRDAMWSNGDRIYAMESYTLALTRDGKLMSAGRPLSPEFGFDLFDWTDIRQVVATDKFVAGLTGDGQVRLTGEVMGYENASNWLDVVQLYYSAGSLVGLTRDGLVLAAGPEMSEDTSRFHDIVRVIPSETDTILISSNGRPAVLRGKGKLGDAVANPGVVDVVSNSLCSVYLMENGTVNPASSYWVIQEVGHWRTSFAGWKDVKQLLLGEECILGLTKDGQVLSAKCLSSTPAPDTSSWTDVVQMAYDQDRGIVYGVTGEGRVLTAAAGTTEAPAELASWENVQDLQISPNYIAALTGDGRVLVWSWPEAPVPLDVSYWEDMSSIALAKGHLVGLRSDGWVLAAGSNEYGQCGAR